ncbi:hypothetical protein SK128_024205, partial [Halocaridina rubra]
MWYCEKQQKKLAKVREREMIKLKCDDMLAISWHNKRQVNVLATVQEGKMKKIKKTCRKTEKPVWKPDAIIDYNIKLGLVDKCDMQFGSIECM